MSVLIDTSFDLRGYIESHIGGRAENQDSAGALETKIGTIVVVCDGMGGMNGGKTASMLAVQTIIDFVAGVSENDDPEEVLENAFKCAHEKIREKSLSDSSLAGMGTTATAIIISKKSATIAHVGDSRIYQLRSKKKVYRTTDHSMVFQLVASGVLSEEQARLSSQSNIILKALGIEGDATPDVKTLPYLKGDRFVLCTDGFWGSQPEDDFIRMISGKVHLKELLWNAVKEVNRHGIISGGGHDNLTAAVIDLNCESKLKPRMTNRMKILLSVVFLLLAFSIGVNFFSYKKWKEYSPKLKAAQEYVSTLSDSSDSVMCVSQKKLIETFSKPLEIKEESKDTLKNQ